MAISKSPLEKLVNSVNKDFWKGKKVFLTGHTGFKGSWLSLWLHKLGANVTGYALDAPTNPNLFGVAHVTETLKSLIGDIRDLPKLTAAMQSVQPEIVIHMAAQPLVRYSYENPVETYTTNVIGTVHLLEAVRLTPSARVVINVTTDKCYENKEWLWPYREDEPMGGYDPYSSSKGCAELVTSAYRRSFLATKNIFVASARAGNVIGGGDWASDRLIPDIIRAFSRENPVIVRNPHAIRPWQHVLEPLSGYLTLAEKLYGAGEPFANAFNFGPQESDARPVKWIVESMTKLWGENSSWQLDATTNPHEAHYLKLDCSKALNLLKWSPRWSLDTALEKVVHWYKANQKGANMQQYCHKQIDEYERAAPLMHLPEET